MGERGIEHLARLKDEAKTIQQEDQKKGCYCGIQERQPKKAGLEALGDICSWQDLRADWESLSSLCDRFSCSYLRDYRKIYNS